MLLDKLLKALQDMENPVKDKVADVKKYTYKYSDLAQVLGIVKPALYKNGLGLLQGVKYEGEVPFLVTCVFDENETLELSRRRLFEYTDAQAEGSGLTYARRYELLTAFGLAAEDDDGAPTKTATPRPSNLAEAQQMLWNAEKEYCERAGIADVRSFHQETMAREDYRNDVITLTRIALELSC